MENESVNPDGRTRGLKELAAEAKRTVSAQSAIRLAVELESQRSQAFKELPQEEKENKHHYYWPPQFVKEVEKETGLKVDTLKGYWKLRVFEDPEISIPEWMIKGHLEDIFKSLPRSERSTEDFKHLFQEFESQLSENATKSLLNKLKGSSDNLDKAQITFLDFFLRYGINTTSEKCRFEKNSNLIAEIYDLEEIDNPNLQSSTVRYAKYGDSLEALEIHDNFKFLLSLIAYQPISEQQLIPFFFLLFDWLVSNRDSILKKDINPQNSTFEIANKRYKFKCIRYLQQEFPDLQCSCEVIPQSRHGALQKRNEDFGIELEFDSKNFIRHGHHKDSRINYCRLIICWQNSLTSGQIKKYSLPPIISISETLKRGFLYVVETD